MRLVPRGVSWSGGTGPKLDLCAVPVGALKDLKGHGRGMVAPLRSAGSPSWETERRRCRRWGIGSLGGSRISAASACRPFDHRLRLKKIPMQFLSGAVATASAEGINAAERSWVGRCYFQFGDISAHTKLPATPIATPMAWISARPRRRAALSTCGCRPLTVIGEAGPARSLSWDVGSVCRNGRRSRQTPRRSVWPGGGRPECRSDGASGGSPSAKSCRQMNVRTAAGRHAGCWW